MFSFQTNHPIIKGDFRLHSKKNDEYHLDKQMKRRFFKQSINSILIDNPSIIDTKNRCLNQPSHFYIIKDLYLYYYDIDDPIITNVSFLKMNFTSFDSISLRPDFIEKCKREQLRANIPILLFYYYFMHSSIGSIYKKNIEKMNEDNGKNWSNIQKILLIETRHEIVPPVEMYDSNGVEMYDSSPVFMHTV